MKSPSVEKKVIGLTVDVAKKHWDDIRIVKIDGKLTIVTRDYRPMRMNVEVKDNKIVGVVSWG